MNNKVKFGTHVKAALQICQWLRALRLLKINRNRLVELNPSDVFPA